VWKNADGSEVWEYPQGFYAVQTFMVAFDPDHVVREVREVLNETYFSRIRPGMSREDVRRLIGKPREIWYFPARDEETWTWRYYDITYRFFNVLFDRSEGTVRPPCASMKFSCRGAAGTDLFAHDRFSCSYSFIASRASLNASTPAGIPQYTPPEAGPRGSHRGCSRW